MPVSIPISCSIETRSSLATLPVAPAGTGQPPSSPKLDSKESTPASQRRQHVGQRLAAGVVEVGGAFDLRQLLGGAAEELADLERVRHPGGVAEADLDRAGGARAGRAISKTRSTGT